MMKEVRTRFAPSPTGGLHLGGVRTALYSYLFAKKHQGSFILRIEDTDQTRYVEAAEQYINDCLEWCGIAPDESPAKGGEYAPYRQSERKDIYRKYAMQLVNSGHAYYAFDTTDELDEMHNSYKLLKKRFQYDHLVRMKMKNSLNLLPSEVEELLQKKTPYVIRLKIPQNQIIEFKDQIRGEISHKSNLLDDKVLLKADGMPTYHLAVVVDDYLMKITHAFRGEEWLPSAPIHILLWKYLGWENEMPQWAHLPLILKPDGNGKLSKRDAERLGFPIFAMDWTDDKTNETTRGFKEIGFMPEAFINLLAMLGWSSGEAKEIFTKDELIEKFSIERVHKAGAKFDFEKAKWYNHEWIKNTDVEKLLPDIKAMYEKNNIVVSETELSTEIFGLIKDRCIVLNDFIVQGSYFFQSPTVLEYKSVRSKWNERLEIIFRELISSFEKVSEWNGANIEAVFKYLASEKDIKVGEMQMPFRVMIVGGKFGPAVYQIAEIIGKEEVIKRCNKSIENIKKNIKMTEVFKKFKEVFEIRGNHYPKSKVEGTAVVYDFSWALSNILLLQPCQIEFNSIAISHSIAKFNNRKSKRKIDLVTNNEDVNICVEFALFRQYSSSQRTAKMLNGVFTVALDSYFFQRTGYFICIVEDKMIGRQLTSRIFGEFPSDQYITKDVIAYLPHTITSRLDQTIIQEFKEMSSSLSAKIIFDEVLSSDNIHSTARILVWECLLIK